MTNKLSSSCFTPDGVNTRINIIATTIMYTNKITINDQTRHMILHDITIKQIVYFN